MGFEAGDGVADGVLARDGVRVGNWPGVAEQGGWQWTLDESLIIVPMIAPKSALKNAPNFAGKLAPDFA